MIHLNDYTHKLYVTIIKKRKDHEFEREWTWEKFEVGTVGIMSIQYSCMKFSRNS